MSDLSTKDFSKPVILGFETRRIMARENGRCVVDMGATGIVASGFIQAANAVDLRNQFENLARYGSLLAFGHPVRSYVYLLGWETPADDIDGQLLARMQDDNLDGAPESFHQAVAGRAFVPAYAPVDRNLVERAMTLHGASLYDLAALLDGPGDGIAKIQMLQSIMDGAVVQITDTAYAWMIRATSGHPLDKKVQDAISAAVLQRRGAPAKVA